MFLITNKEGKFLLKDESFGSQKDYEMIHIFDHFLTASQYAMKHGLDVMDLKQYVELLMASKSQNALELKIEELEVEVARLREQLAAITKLNISLVEQVGS